MVAATSPLSARAMSSRIIPTGPRALAALSKMAGKPVEAVTGEGLTRLDPRKDLRFDTTGKSLSFAARYSEVRYQDGTSGTIYVVHAYKKQGDRIPMDEGWDRRVNKELQNRAQELRSESTSHVVDYRRYDSEIIPTHVSGIGPTERGWV